MGLFDRLYYGKAGKRDYSEMDMPKNRVSLFFLVLKDHLFDLIKVNFLQLIFWLPFIIWTFINLTALQMIDSEAILAAEGGAQALIGSMSGYLMMWLIGCIPCMAITGPSSAGAAYIMRNWARDQHAFLLSDFKDAFKGNWKQALLTSLIDSLVPILTYTGVVYYSMLSSGNKFMFLPLVLILSAAIMWQLMLPLIYPMMIGYELKTKYIFKNALLMACARLPQLLLARVITFIPIAALLISLYMGNGVVLLIVLFYYLLFGFAFSRLLYASVANSVFDRYLNPHIEGATVGQGLRPHTDEDDILDDEDDEDEYEDDDEDGENA